MYHRNQHPDLLSIYERIHAVFTKERWNVTHCRLSIVLFQEMWRTHYMTCHVSITTWNPKVTWHVSMQELWIKCHLDIHYMDPALITDRKSHSSPSAREPNGYDHDAVKTTTYNMLHVSVGIVNQCHRHFSRAFFIIITLGTIASCRPNGDCVDAGRITISCTGIIILSTISWCPNVYGTFALSTLQITESAEKWQSMVCCPPIMYTYTDTSHKLLNCIVQSL